MYSTPRVLHIGPTPDFRGSSWHNVLMTAIDSAPALPNIMQSVTAFLPTPRMPRERVSSRARRKPVETCTRAMAGSLHRTWSRSMVT